MSPRRIRAALLVLLALTGTDASRAEDLLQAYAHALTSDPVLAQAQASLDADLQGKPLARSALLPHVAMAAGEAKNNAGITGFGLPISSYYISNSFSVTLTQAILNGQAMTALSQADNRVQAAEAALVYAQQQLALKVVNAYFGVLQARALEKVAQEELTLFDNINDQTKATLDVGTGDAIAVAESRARLDAAQSDLIKARNAVRVALRTLERLTHQPVPSLQDLGLFEPLLPQPDQSESWVETALANQPLVREGEAQLRLAQDETDFNRRARWPVVNLEGITQHTLGTPFPSLDINQRGVGVNLSMPLFDSGQISASVDQAEARRRAAQNALANVRDQVTLDTQTAFLNLQDSVAQLRSADTALNSAKVSLDGTRTGFEIGTRSIIDLLNVAAGYIRAEQDYHIARYTHVMARIGLKAASGLLTRADLESVNALLDHAQAPH